jgi:hypothetical protein
MCLRSFWFCSYAFWGSRTAVVPELRRWHLGNSWMFMNFLWISGEMNLLANCPRGATCADELGFSHGESPFKRRVRWRILSSCLLLLASSRLSRGPSPHFDLVHFGLCVEDHLLVYIVSVVVCRGHSCYIVVPFIKGFGWGQRARAYSRPFTWNAVEGWIWFTIEFTFSFADFQV